MAAAVNGDAVLRVIQVGRPDNRQLFSEVSVISIPTAKAMRWQFTKVLVAAGLVAALAGGSGGAAAAAARPPVLRAVLSGVSCKGPSFCMAVGNYSVPKDHDVRLAEEWNGKTCRAVPDPLSGNLDNITCGSPSFCLADRLVNGLTGVYSLVEWNGRTWQTLKHQPPGLYDVSCGSPPVCMAANTPSGDIYGWNGMNWQDLGDCSLGPPGQCSWLSNPTCGGATCIIAGWSCGDDDCDESAYFALTWPLTNDGLPPIPSPFLTSEACAGQGFCMFTGGGNRVAWFTTNWAQTWQLALPGCPIGSCDFDGPVSCGYAGTCMSLPIGWKLSLAWDGTKWTAPLLARIAGKIPQLTSLSCGNADNCVAVGSYKRTPHSRRQTIAEHWNGSKWQVTFTPDS